VSREIVLVEFDTFSDVFVRRTQPVHNWLKAKQSVTMAAAKSQSQLTKVVDEESGGVCRESTRQSRSDALPETPNSVRRPDVLDGLEHISVAVKRQISM
jgi:hypothetical protein